jgi:hypothetical protein
MLRASDVPLAGLELSFRSSHICFYGTWNFVTLCDDVFRYTTPKRRSHTDTQSKKSFTRQSELAHLCIRITCTLEGRGEGRASHSLQRRRVLICACSCDIQIYNPRDGRGGMYVFDLVPSTSKHLARSHMQLEVGEVSQMAKLPLSRPVS